MRTNSCIGICILLVLVFFNSHVFSQQLKLGSDPAIIEKSAVLELQSGKQGLLLTRIADTTLINTLDPPDGMLIYFTPAKLLMLRSNGYWQALTTPAFLNNYWSASGNTGTNPTTNFIGTTDNQDLVFKTNSTERARIISSSGDIKIGSATTGTIKATQELVLRQDGDTYGPSILRLRNRTGENGAIFETTDPTITLVDFIFKTSANQRNIRYEARAGSAKTGSPSFHIGGTNPDNPTLSVGDNYAAFRTNLKIGNYSTPTEALDVTGNLRFSGALMPNNNAGTTGYLLSSNGTGAAPSWMSVGLANLSDATILSPASGQLLQYNGSKWVNYTPSFLTTIDTSNISIFYLKVRGLHSAGAGISYNAATGVIANSGVLSLNGNTGALTMDTGYIANFYQKVRGLSSASAPITLTNGQIGITQASGATNGYLSSTDWNTFNNKLGSVTSGNLSESTSSVLTITGGTNAVLGSGTSVQVKQASSSQSGFLSNMDWNTFNNKLSAIDTSNISNFYLKVRGLHSAGAGISYNAATGVIANSGVLSLNGNTGALTMDTGYIANFYQKVRSLSSASAPITLTNGQIGINQASGSTNGYLSSTDWNTFNNKLGSVTSGNLTESTSSVLTITGGANAVLGSGTSLQVKQASSSQSGFLSGTDWNTFNNKLSSVDTSNISNFYLKVRGLHSAGAGISYNAATGVIANSGVLSLNGNTGALTMDTGYIANFYQKVRSLSSAAAPITLTNGQIGITQASGATNGYLSSTDWNTFNNKLSTVDTSNISNFYLKVRGLLSAGSGISYNSATGAISTTVNSSNLWSYDGNTVGSVKNLGTIDNYTLPFITNNIERMRIDGSGRVGIGITNPTNPLVVKDTLEVRRVGSVSQLIFSNTAGTGDFRIGADGGDIFWQGGGGRNLQMGSYWTTVLAGDRQTATFPSFATGTTNTGILIPAQRDASVPLAIQGNSATQTANLTEWRTSSGTVLNVVDKNGNVGLANITPSEKLDITGNLKFSGALMPNNSAGTSGYILKSNGSGSAPAWINNMLGNLTDVTTTSPSSGHVLQYNGTNWVNSSTWSGSIIQSAYGGTGNGFTKFTGPATSEKTFTLPNASATILTSNAAVTIAQGGTGQTTANAALNALLPSQTGNSGNYLTSDGTNTSWSDPIISADNYVYSYSTSTKTFSTAGTWADITFNTAHPQLSGWSHSLTTNAQNFTCNQTGVYQVIYSGQANNTTTTTYELDIRATLNGTEIAGSVTSIQCSTTNPSITNNFLVSVNSGQVLKLQLTGSNTAMQLAPGAYGTTKPTITITIIRIK